MNKRVLIGALSLAAVAGVLLPLARRRRARAQARARGSRSSRTDALRSPPSPAPNGQESTTKPDVPRSRELLFVARWGGAADELGRERPPEGNPLGPMSVAVDAKGRLLVLDEVNARIVRRAADGKLDHVRVDVKNPEDLAVGADGSSAVLDRFADKSVTVYDDYGKVRGKLPLLGDGISDTGSVTGVFVDSQRRLRGARARHAGQDRPTNGAPAEPRSEIPGRPSRDGLSYLNAGLIEASAGRVYVSSIVRATSAHRFTRELRLESTVRSILLLDSDKSGVVYFAAEVSRSAGDDAILLSCLDGESGAPVGSAVLPVNTLPEESFRDLIVLDGGGVIHALRTEAGVTYTLYSCE